MSSARRGHSTVTFVVALKVGHTSPKEGNKSYLSANVAQSTFCTVRCVVVGEDGAVLEAFSVGAGALTHRRKSPGLPSHEA